MPIPSFGLIDDNLIVSETVFKAEEVNIFMNKNSSEKNLQFNHKKCKYLSVGKNKETSQQHTLEVETRTITYDKDNNLIETEGEKKRMEEVN